MPLTEALLQPVFDHPSFKAALAAVSEATDGRAGHVTLSGLTGAGKALIVAGLAHEIRARKIERPLLVVTSDNETAEQLRETTSTFLDWLESGAGEREVHPEKGLGETPALLSVLPAFDVSPYEARSPHAEILERRAVTLGNVARGRTRVLLVPLAAALARFRERAFYASLALELRAGDELDRDDVVQHLAGVGYEAGEPVASVGQYSVRGGIVDVFPPEAEHPFRIEFFGDTIESLREFDPATQRSRQSVASATLLPLTEAPRSPKFFAALVRALAARRARRESGTGSRESGVGYRDPEPEWAAQFGGPFPGWEFFVPLAEPHPNTLFSLLGPSAPEPARAPVLLVWDEELERLEELKRTLEGCRAAYDEVRDSVPPPPRPEDFLLTDDEFLKSVEGAPQLSLKELAVGGAVVAGRLSDKLPTTDLVHPASSEFFLPTEPAPKFHGAVKAFIEDVKSRLEGGERVALVMPTPGKVERLQQILTEYEVPFGGASDSLEPSASPESEVPSPAFIVRGEMPEGVAVPELRLLLLADVDLFGGFDWGAPGRREKSRASSFISDLSDLKVGDYVVHVDHGIGLYQGLRQIEVDGATRDFMLLTYQEEARLYVPLERLDLVEKYRASGDGAKPVLDRLGGVTWARTKSRVKRALRDMAQELLRIYAERKMGGGVAYSADTPWQHEFEEAFEFQETPDQLTALDDIKRDLESPHPMDRLLCGDVGYGKTELAMRAAFKVLQEGKQVAVLTPTTVLAFQHFTTFRQRMSAFPVRIEMVSRFRSAAEQKKTLAETEAGKVDILIGTHRLLSKDVGFHDLGLLVVDEEQRFGVAAKEKLKKLKANVDVLTMSATPIPRTLNMSLGGLRDLSVIETPPRGRLAIQTVVAAFGEGLIQAAILQEMGRDGQVYFVHNRVESIWSMASLVQKLVPTARLGVAHGQMDEKELERVMLKFIQGEYDVLVSTVLIENGLDIPRANTLIVNHAERFGLADLYQLRGRVGRSTRRAYAYFLIPAENALTPLAKRRLAALKEFSDLGAGFRLAALDLELRGAGNLLGAEQSGHLNSVGIDLYLRMLQETVEELRGAAPQPEVRTTLNLGLDIKIPDDYISDERQRLRMYKRLSSLSTVEACADLEAELLDRYGPVPASVRNLFSYALLKSAAERLLVQSIERQEDEVRLRFHAQAPVDPEKLTQFLRRRRDSSFRPDGVLRFKLASDDGHLPEQIQNALQELHA
jgi:transcription-repair coupling factor (superfamily II helicase)